MSIQGKVWGTTQQIISGHNFEIHRIEIIAGGYCSKHEHAHKHNMFYVESGWLQIDVYVPAKRKPDSTILSAGESTTIEPGKIHMFKALKDTVAYEIYWLDDIDEDITRYSEGGVENSD